MPVFLFALSQAPDVNWPETILAFLILHLLIFPSSNGYNSYQDRDETSIGGLKYPPRVSRNLFFATILLDILGVACGIFVSIGFALMVMIFVLASRAYSYRNIRIKKYPVMGFLTVFFFQGAFVFMMASSAIGIDTLQNLFSSSNIMCMSISSLFIGSIYPLTQIYQHQADKNDGVITISYKLGYTGTFIFSLILFFSATVLLFLYFIVREQQIAFLMFLLITLPVAFKLQSWFKLVRKDSSQANFVNTMAMNVMASSCMNLYFLLLILSNYFSMF